MSKISNFVLRHGKDNLRTVARRLHSKRWLADNIVRSPGKDIVIPNVCLNEYIWTNLDKWATKTALVCGFTDRSYTYEELYKKSRRFGAKLRNNFDIKDGDVIAMMMANQPEYPVAVFGALEAGAILSPVNPQYTVNEASKQFIGSSPKVVIASPETLQTVKDTLKLLKKKLPIIVINYTNQTVEEAASFKELVEDENIDLSILKEVKTSSDDVCFLPYSSGTTGMPKGVQLTHRNMVANCAQQSTEFKQHEDTSVNYQASVLAVLPMFHSYGLSVVMAHKLSQGLKEVVLPGFKPETYVRVLEKHRITNIYAVPPILLFMGSNQMMKEKHFEHINYIVSGAAPLPVSDVDKMFTKANRDFCFMQGYGLTETSPLATVGLKEFPNYSSVGFAIPNVLLRIVDDDFKSLGPNMTGELLIKGPNVMKGYKNNPEADKEIFVEDGWMRSGDQGKIDESGMLFILDRLKELIKVKGFQVPPAEIESVLKEHKDVLDAAVIGVPDKKTGERPKAFVILKPESVDADASSIIKFVNERLSSYKHINDLNIVDAIPKNPTGKILRRVLKEQYS